MLTSDEVIPRDSGRLHVVEALRAAPAVFAPSARKQQVVRFARGRPCSWRIIGANTTKKARMVRA